MVKSKIIKAMLLAVAVTATMAAPTFAAGSTSTPELTACQKAHEDIRFYGKKQNSDDYSVPETEKGLKCKTVKLDGKDYIMYSDTSKGCAQAGNIAANPEACNGSDFNGFMSTIINAVIGVIGIVAVIMIILGGISYATSQGDPGKVKKGKDTILYGIIGLVVALLAFAIVNFVLTSLE